MAVQGIVKLSICVPFIAIDCWKEEIYTLRYVLVGLDT